MLKLLLILALCVPAVANSRRGRIHKQYSHQHCAKHRHDHAEGMAYHDRFKDYSGAWDLVRFKAIEEAGPYFGIDDGTTVDKSSSGRKHRHCFRHAHTHGNAGFWHMEGNLSKAFRLK